MESLRILMKSTLSRTMCAIQEGCAANLSKRGYGIVSDSFWKSAISDDKCLLRPLNHQSHNARLVHFIPNFDGNPGMPFQRDIPMHRYLDSDTTKPAKIPSSSLKTPVNASPIPIDVLKSLLKETPQVHTIATKGITHKPNKHFEQIQFNGATSKFNMTQSTSIGVDDEALYFSTNFVLMAFLFFMVVLMRDN